jgi:hypothetical protein
MRDTILMSAWCKGETGFILQECNFFFLVADYLDIRNVDANVHAFQTSVLSGGELSAVLTGFITSGRDKWSGGNCRSIRGMHCRSGDGDEKSVGNGVHVV